MPGATSSGADTGGTARNRDQKGPEPEARRYTTEQMTTVLRIRRCSPTAFYEILAVEKTATEGDIKKAYRKLSLLTHPDKNGHEYADEAFKMVSRAFGVLGDKEKREKFDRFGTDPDSRFASAQAQNPFSGFARRHPSGAGGGAGGDGGGFGGFPGGGGFAEEMTPEEMFQRFFGGGGLGGGPFGAFDTGPQFVFNFGGGPGFRVHQFGGARPRGRPRNREEEGQGGSTLQTLLGLLPIIFFFVIPLLTSLFSSSNSAPPGPRMVYDQPIPPYTHKRSTPNFKVDYFVNPNDIAQYSGSKLSQLDKSAESNLIRVLRNDCELEERTKQRMIDDAYGWLFPDQKKLDRANAFELKSCDRLKKLGVRR